MGKSEKRPTILKILEALPEGKTGIEGKSIVELCSMLVKWVENRSLYSDIGSGSAQSRVDFLKKIGFDNFKFNYQYRLGHKQRVYDAKITSAEDFVTTMNDLQDLPSKSGQLDALKEAISRQIADYILSQIPTATDEKNPISLDDEFAVSLTRDVLGVADDVNMVQTVQEYANNGANTAAVIDALQATRKKDQPSFMPDDVAKSLKSITPVKPPKEKTRFKDVVANLFTRKERSVNLDNVARYVAMSMLLSVDPELSGYDKLNLVMKEYRLRSVDGIKRGAPETEGVDYEGLVSGAMQSIRDNRLAISNNTPYQKAINSFIDAGGVDANIPEDVKAELSKEGILDKLKLKVLEYGVQFDASLNAMIEAREQAEPVATGEDAPAADEERVGVWAKIKGLVKKKEKTAETKPENPEEETEKVSKWQQWKAQRDENKLQAQKDRIQAIVIDVYVLTELATENEGNTFYNDTLQKVSDTITKYKGELVAEVQGNFDANKDKFADVIAERRKDYESQFETYKAKQEKANRPGFAERRRAAKEARATEKATELTERITDALLCKAAIEELIKNDPDKAKYFDEALAHHTETADSYKHTKEYAAVMERIKNKEFEAEYQEILNTFTEQYELRDKEAEAEVDTDSDTSKKGKLNKERVKKTKAERDAFSLTEFVKDDGLINQYLSKIIDKNVESVYKSCKDYLVELSKTDDKLNDKKYNNLKSLFINLKSVLGIIPNAITEDNQIEKFAPVDAIISGIKMESDRLQAEAIIDVVDNAKLDPAPEKNIVQRIVSIRDGLTQGNANFTAVFNKVFENIDLTNTTDVKAAEKEIKKRFGVTTKSTDREIAVKIQKYADKHLRKDSFFGPMMGDFDKAFINYIDTTFKGGPEPLSTEKFALEYAKILAQELIKPKLDTNIPGLTVMDQVRDSMYRSIKLDNRKLLHKIPQDFENMVDGFGQNAALFNESLIHGVVGIPSIDDIRDVKLPGGIDFSKLPPAIKAQVQQNLERLINGSEKWLGVTKENMMEGFDKGSKKTAPVVANEVSTSEISGWADLDKFMSADEMKLASMGNYSQVYTSSIDSGINIIEFIRLVETDDVYKAIKETLDGPDATDKKQAAIQSILHDNLINDPNAVKTLQDLVSGSITKDQIPGILAKTLVETYEPRSEFIETVKSGKSEHNVEDPELVEQYVDHHAIVVAFARTKEELIDAQNAGDNEKVKTLSERLVHISRDYTLSIARNVSKGIVLSDVEREFLISPDGKNSMAALAKEEQYAGLIENLTTKLNKSREAGDDGISKETRDSANTYEAKRDEYYALVDAAPDKKVDEATTKAYMEILVNRIICTDGAQLIDDRDQELINDHVDMLATILSTKSSFEIQTFCKNIKETYPILAGNPKIKITESVNDVGDTEYSLSIAETKSFGEVFPGTDINQRISKMVKDLKDSYVYLKPGIKMCDKLLDFIKTLNFNVTTPVIANENTIPGKKPGPGPSDTPVPSGDKDKDPALAELRKVLDEIRNELVKLASLIDKLNKNPNDENMKKEISESYDKCGKDLDKAQGIVNTNKENENIQKLQPDVDTLRGQWFNLGKTLSAQVTIGLGQGQPGPDGTPTYVLQNSMLAFWAMVSGNAQILSDIRGYNNLSTLFAAPQKMTVESYVTIENVSYKVAVDVNVPRETKGETNRFSNSISTLIKSIVEKTGSVDMVAIHQGLVEAFNTSNVNDEFYGFSVNGEVKIEDLSKRTAKVNTGSTVVGPAKGEHEVEKTSEIITPTTGAQQPVASDKNRFTITFDGKNVILLDNGKKISERPGDEKELASLETALKTANASAPNHQQALIEQFIRNNGMQPIEKEMGDD